MPFGLRYAPGTFQRTMGVILSSLRWQYALVYFDDIVVNSEISQERMRRVREVLTLLCDAGVTLSPKNCKFFTDTIDYLRHVIRPRRFETSFPTTNAIRGLKTLTNLTEP